MKDRLITIILILIVVICVILIRLGVGMDVIGDIEDDIKEKYNGVINR